MSDPDGRPSSNDETAVLRPTRPALVELAAAILIVGGALGLITALNSVANVPAGIEPFGYAAVGLTIGSVIVGLLVRGGRAWLLAVNYAAVLGFLDLLGSGASPLFLMLGIAEVVAVGIVLTQKPWFDAMGAWRAASETRALTRR